MKAFLLFFLNKFYGKSLCFRVRLFNILAAAGIVISLISAAVSLVNGEGVFSVLLSFFAALSAAFLMYFTSKTGRYELCCAITIIIVFFGIFPAIFMNGGGYLGAMPYFFIFAAVFTVFMLHGKKALIIVAAELLFYIGLCVFAYYYPDYIAFHKTREAVVFDIIIGFVCVSVSLAITMFLHIRLYESQQKELEAARAAAIRQSDAKTNFLSRISHEIRTPINVMLGMNEMIFRESESEKIREYSEKVEGAGMDLLQMVNEVLDMSKIEQGKLELSAEPYCTAALVNDLKLIGEAFAAKKGLSFAAKACAGLPEGLEGDFLKIKQIGANFLSNAAKYTDDGEITLSVSYENGRLEIAVSDTGSGIGEGELSLLFKPFSRARFAIVGQTEGSGLGLSISKAFADLMGGKITVESVPGKGSRFAFSVVQPLAIPVCKSSKTLSEGFIAPAAKILAVDDSAENLMVIQELLKHTLIRVVTAQSGEEAVLALAEGEFDLVLMDYMMPDMDGAAALAKMRENNFGSPAVALTANVVLGTREKLLAAGFDRVVAKPVSCGELEAVIRELVPAEKIISGNKSVAARQPVDIHTVSGRLEDGGITLSAPLGRLGGDIYLYGRLAAIFHDEYSRERTKIVGLTGDGGALLYRVHSLKGRALAVGAGELANTSALLEEKLRGGKYDYIKLLLPLLLYQWDSAQKAVERVLPLFENTCNGGEKPSFEMLLSWFNTNRQLDIAAAIADLIDCSQTEETRLAFEEILSLTEEMKLREAEILFRKLMEKTEVIV